MDMKSDLVVISWWSNCLGLTCLHKLVKHTTNRNIYLIQVGKQEEQKKLFRYYMPKDVIELPYDSNLGAEDWQVREAIAGQLLKDHSGLWFFDHDLFVKEDCDAWLNEMDKLFRDMNVCLSHPSLNGGFSITNPAFWLSPVRFPKEMQSFAPIPRRNSPIANKPYAERQSSELLLPQKDTLVVAMEYLNKLGMVSSFPLKNETRENKAPPPFPKHEHIGSLSIFTWQDLPRHLYGWMARMVEQYNAFYAACAPEWRSIEDPVLKQRIQEFSKLILS